MVDPQTPIAPVVPDRVQKQFLKPTIYEILYAGLENVTSYQDFMGKSNDVLTRVFDYIFDHQDEIRWERTAEGMRGKCEFETIIKISNYLGNVVEITVGFIATGDFGLHRYILYLGDKNGPSRDQADPRMAEFAKMFW